MILILLKKLRITRQLNFSSFRTIVNDIWFTITLQIRLFALKNINRLYTFHIHFCGWWISFGHLRDFIPKFKFGILSQILNMPLLLVIETIPNFCILVSNFASISKYCLTSNLTNLWSMTCTTGPKIDQCFSDLKEQNKLGSDFEPLKSRVVIFDRPLR